MAAKQSNRHYVQVNCCGSSDKQSANQPESQTVLGYVRMCFYKYPQHKRYKALICNRYEPGRNGNPQYLLRRWSIEVVFKELKQYFGYDQSKSSKYAPQIADLTIRCIFYNMFCSLKYDYPSKAPATANRVLLGNGRYLA